MMIQLASNDLHEPRPNYIGVPLISDVQTPGEFLYESHDSSSRTHSRHIFLISPFFTAVVFIIILLYNIIELTHHPH